MPNIPNEKVGKGICNKFKVVGNVYNSQQRAIGIGAEYLSLGIKSNIKDRIEIGIFGKFGQWANQKMQNIFGKF